MRPEDQPDPVTFCAPLDLDGDPPPRQLTPRILVAALVFVVVALIVATLEGCAPSLQGKRWSPPTVTVALDPSAPACAEWAVNEAWTLLKPSRPLTIRRGGFSKENVFMNYIALFSRMKEPMASASSGVVR